MPKIPTTHRVAPLVKFEKNWFMNPNFNGASKYGDTDSITLEGSVHNLMVRLYGPDWKIEDVDLNLIVKYIIRYGEALQQNYQDTINISMKTNANPEHNHMNAKLEVISLGSAYFKKKFYVVCPELYNEGTSFVDTINGNPTVALLKENDKFWDLLKMKGGPLVKSDASTITKEMVMEIYEYIAQLLIGEIKYTKANVYNMLNVTIRNKYKGVIERTLTKKEYSKCVQTKKYPTNELKSIPKHQKAAMLWNLIVDDTIRAGDTFYVLDITFLDAYAFQKQMPKADNEYQLTVDLADHTLTQIAVPHGVESSLLDKLDEMLQQFNIVVDVDKIVDFNVNMKISMFEPLYEL